MPHVKIVIVSAQHFLAPVPEQVQDGAVGLEKMTIGYPANDNGNRAGFKNAREQRLRTTQFLVGLLALGDIADEADEAVAALQAHFGKHDLDGHFAPTSMQSHNLDTFPVACTRARCQKACYASLMCGLKALRLDSRQRLPDQFLAGVAEHLAGSWIGEANDVPFINDERAVVGGLPDRAESLLALTQALFRRLSFRAPGSK